ncbi:STAS domain-containing protein [Hydrogenophaga pseudoflava]|uniref:STAS domain-containing protein n=1 Tax=Hydrogenophaga pseudoflava TaxID=47421 RepID=UPI0027E3D138|nr:STAS domain-containing protein [Hydrogenophaga pseudoflava]MDQ7746105.1 STAS domain-containing protein [Hydrogenophaga pseudoflava]
MDAQRRLPPELTIYTASELCAQARTWLAEHTADSGDGWTLEASAVDQVDAAGVQLLLSLARSLEDRSQALRLAQPSTPLVDACAALGLAGWLSDRTAQGATP